ncbi:hypothetical protein Ancab_025268 [Ancistrocladus abbreviatus]
MAEKVVEEEETVGKEGVVTPLVGLSRHAETKLGAFCTNDDIAENRGERSTGGNIHINYVPLAVDDSQRHMGKSPADMEVIRETMGPLEDEANGFERVVGHDTVKAIGRVIEEELRDVGPVYETFHNKGGESGLSLSHGKIDDLETF